jgi:hypothetical protein
MNPGDIALLTLLALLSWPLWWPMVLRYGWGR